MNKNPISFDQAWADSFTSENGEVRELGNTLLELAEKGRLTVDTFNEADSTGYFKNLGISADEAVSISLPHNFQHPLPLTGFHNILWYPQSTGQENHCCLPNP